MPAIQLYVDDEDVELIRLHLNLESELSWVVSDGPDRWRAVSKTHALPAGRHCLWHAPSGPLPLMRADDMAPKESILDPEKGWTGEVQGADRRYPYFGAGHPGVIWFNCRTKSVQTGIGIGLSSFEWIGRHYAVIGNAPAPATEMYWKRLRTWITKNSVKIPRAGPLDRGKCEINAFPSSLRAIRSGTPRDANP